MKRKRYEQRNAKKKHCNDCFSFHVTILSIVDIKKPPLPALLARSGGVSSEIRENWSVFREFTLFSGVCTGLYDRGGGNRKYLPDIKIMHFC
jgi:hypothetical protein